MLTEIQQTFDSLDKKYKKLRQDLSSLTGEVLNFKDG
jgi:hypothetical protein